IYKNTILNRGSDHPHQRDKVIEGKGKKALFIIYRREFLTASLRVPGQVGIAGENRCRSSRCWLFMQREKCLPGPGSPKYAVAGAGRCCWVSRPKPIARVRKCPQSAGQCSSNQRVERQSQKNYVHLWILAL